VEVIIFVKIYFVKTYNVCKLIYDIKEIKNIYYQIVMDVFYVNIFDLYISALSR